MAKSEFISYRTDSCLHCFSRKTSLFSDLNKEELHILDSNKYALSYKAGDVICKAFSNPLGLICLRNGTAKVTNWNTNGNEQILGLKTIGDFIGFRELFSGLRYSSSVVALENCSVCIITKEAFFEVLKNQPFIYRVIQYLCYELINKEINLLRITKKDMRERLSEVLLSLENVFGTNSNTGYININLKRSELASLANMNVSNAIRTLSAFQKEKLIEVYKRTIKIIDHDALVKVSSPYY